MLMDQMRQDFLPDTALTSYQNFGIGPRRVARFIDDSLRNATES